MPPNTQNQGKFWHGQRGVPTSIESLDDGGGTIDVEEEIVEPAVVREVEEDVEAVPQGRLCLLLPLPCLIWVVLGAEPVFLGGGMTWGREGDGKRGVSGIGGYSPAPAWGPAAAGERGYPPPHHSPSPVCFFALAGRSGEPPHLAHLGRGDPCF